MLTFKGAKHKEDEFASPAESAITKACEIAIEFRREVLTVFCLKNHDEKTRATIFSCLGDIPVVEIATASISYTAARKHLAIMAKENGIVPDKKLYKRLADENALYNGNDLSIIFNDWYHYTLKTRIYPQYSFISSSYAVASKAPPKGSAYDELYQMTGLSEAKKVINNALNYFKMQRLFTDRGVVVDRPAMHMVFTGNPGTAKTSVARLFARIMKENGLLSVGEMIEVGRADIVGKYVGWTAKIVKDKFRAARGSVLFVDEAYSLVDDRQGLYGDEAINTIVQEMENNREDMVVIFAGYPLKMEEFLNRNPGLRSRIAFHVPFMDYSPRELYSILEFMSAQKKMQLAENTKDKLLKIFEDSATMPDFGNGRFVRNLLETAKMRQASRLACMDFDKITDSELFTLTAEDFEYESETLAASQKRVIGF